jgi:hypothetical protein
MDSSEHCGCAQHGGHHGEQHGDRQEGHDGGCGCGGHGHQGAHKAGAPHAGCTCGCHQPQGETGFQRRYISRDEVINRLGEYLKQLQAEAKGVEERIAEMKEHGGPQQT